MIFFIGANNYIDGNTIYLVSPNEYYYNNATAPAGTNYNSVSFVNNDQNTYYWGNKSLFLANFIDYDNLVYNPQIPRPEIDVSYILSVDLPEEREPVFNAQLVVGDNSNYYVEILYKFGTPGSVELGLNSLGKVVYTYDLYDYSQLLTLYGLQDNKRSINIVLDDEFLPAFTIFYNTVRNMQDYPLFWSVIPGWNSEPIPPRVTQAKAYYLNYMMSQMPMYGNRLEFFVRYYTIDSSNRVVVGDWVHWQSRTGSITVEPPADYVDNVALPGYVDYNNDTYNPADDTYTGTGAPTGISPLVINNTLVPNYPDYPTIADFNRDNILTSYMDTARSLPDYFREFGRFCTDTFSFIPAFVWGIITFGFLGSIIIMFIKIL